MKKTVSLLPLTILLACVLFSCKKPGDGGNSQTPSVMPPKVSPEKPREKEPMPVMYKVSVSLPTGLKPDQTRESVVKGSPRALYFGTRLTGEKLEIEAPHEYAVKLVSDKPVDRDITFSVGEVSALMTRLTEHYSAHGALPLSALSLPAKTVMRRGEREAVLKIGLKDEVSAFILKEKTRKGFITALAFKASSERVVFDEKQSLIGIVTGVTVEKPAEPVPPAKKPEAKQPEPKQPEPKKPEPKKPEAKQPEPKKPQTPKPPVAPNPTPGRPGTPVPPVGPRPNPTPGRPTPAPKEKATIHLSMPSTAESIFGFGKYDLPFKIQNERLVRDSYVVTLRLSKPVTKRTTIRVSTDTKFFENTDADKILPFFLLDFQKSVELAPGFGGSVDFTVTLKMEDNPLLYNPYNVKRLISKLKFTCDDPEVEFDHNTVGIEVKYDKVMDKSSRKWPFAVYSYESESQRGQDKMTESIRGWATVVEPNASTGSQRDPKNKITQMFDKDFNTYWWADSNSQTYVNVRFGDERFPRAERLRGIRIHANKYIKSANIQVSVDGEHFIDLMDIVPEKNAESVFVEFNNPTKIKAVRIGHFVGWDGAYVNITEMYFFK